MLAKKEDGASMQSESELQKRYDELTRSPAWRRFNLLRRLHGMLLSTVVLMMVALPVAAALFAGLRAGSFWAGCGGFAIGVCVSVILNKANPFKVWTRRINEREHGQFRDVLATERLLRRAKASALNNAGVALFSGETVSTRDFLSEMPPQIVKAKKLFGKAMWVAPDWAVPVYNIACCFYFLNLLKSGIRNMGNAVRIAQQTPDDEESQYVAERANKFMARVVAAGKDWMLESKIIDPCDFIPYPHDHSGQQTKSVPPAEAEAPMVSATHEAQPNTNECSKCGSELMDLEEMLNAQLTKRGMSEVGAAQKDYFRALLFGGKSNMKCDRCGKWVCFQCLLNVSESTPSHEGCGGTLRQG